MLHRINYFPDLETRAKERIIRGISMPFDSPTYIRSAIEGEFWEEFSRGAFTKTISENPKGFTFNILHDRRTRLPIGVSVVTREDTKGLYQEFRVSDTDAGNEVLALAADGVPLGLSIGFAPIKDRWNPDKTRVYRNEVKLKETSVVNEPAYAEAQVIGVRYGNLEEREAEPTPPEPPDEGTQGEPVVTSNPEPPEEGHSLDPNSREARLAEVASYRERLHRLQKSFGIESDR